MGSGKHWQVFKIPSSVSSQALEDYLNRGNGGRFSVIERMLGIQRAVVYGQGAEKPVPPPGLTVTAFTMKQDRHEKRRSKVVMLHICSDGPPCTVTLNDAMCLLNEIKFPLERAVRVFLRGQQEETKSRGRVKVPIIYVEMLTQDDASHCLHQWDSHYVAAFSCYVFLNQLSTREYFPCKHIQEVVIQPEPNLYPHPDSQDVLNLPSAEHGSFPFMEQPMPYEAMDPAYPPYYQGELGGVGYYPPPEFTGGGLPREEAPESEWALRTHRINPEPNPPPAPVDASPLISDQETGFDAETGQFSRYLYYLRSGDFEIPDPY